MSVGIRESAADALCVNFPPNSKGIEDTNQWFVYIY